METSPLSAHSGLPRPARTLAFKASPAVEDPADSYVTEAPVLDENTTELSKPREPQSQAAPTKQPPVTLTEISPTPPLLAGECEEVLLGLADEATCERVSTALLHRLDVHERARGPVDPELRTKLREGHLVEVLGDLQTDQHEFVAQHMVFTSVDGLAHWLGVPIPDTVEPARKAVVVGGLHGNEHSGMEAAEDIADMHRGDDRVTVFSRANPWAAAANTRTSGDTDMNRIFPGNPEGTPEEQRAHQIFQEASRADLVIDLHEALADWRQGRSGRLCMFQPNPRTLAFLKKLQPFLDKHDFRLVPFRYEGTLVQEAVKDRDAVGLLFEVPLTLDYESRTALATELTRTSLAAAFKP